MIRKASEKDLPFIYETLKETGTPWTQTGVSESIKNDLVLVLEDTGVIIAKVAADECEILNFAVCREKRGQGYGKELLDALLKRAETHGAKTVFLDVRKTNETAIYVYKNAGFQICGERKNFYHNPQEDAVLMKKGL